MGMYHGAVREEKDAEAVFPWLGEKEKVFLTGREECKFRIGLVGNGTEN